MEEATIRAKSARASVAEISAQRFLSAPMPIGGHSLVERLLEVPLGQVRQLQMENPVLVRVPLLDHVLVDRLQRCQLFVQFGSVFHGRLGALVSELHPEVRVEQKFHGI